MTNFNLILLQILIILAIYILLFTYSAISADMMTTCISFMIFLILLLPFIVLLEKLKILLHISNVRYEILFNMLIFYSTVIIIFIGFFLFIQLIYLFLNG